MDLNLAARSRRGEAAGKTTVCGCTRRTVIPG